jgi:hypothetical protein
MRVSRGISPIIDEIIHTTADMGVVLDNDDFDTFSFLNDLENARHDLYQKQIV